MRNHQYHLLQDRGGLSINNNNEFQKRAHDSPGGGRNAGPGDLDYLRFRFIRLLGGSTFLAAFSFFFCVAYTFANEKVIGRSIMIVVGALERNGRLPSPGGTRQPPVSISLTFRGRPNRRSEDGGGEDVCPVAPPDGARTSFFDGAAADPPLAADERFVLVR